MFRPPLLAAFPRAAAVQAAYVVLLDRYPAQADDLNAKRADRWMPLGMGQSAAAGWSGDNSSPMPFSCGGAPMDSHRRRPPISVETK
jgi:hypothetical protein